ncbi:hypothetical protein TNCV_1921661 [Trichonephila clavipes]|nr:hypothetical protein TNCV_1921661 [Trichonephila clavipes]
MEDSMDAGNAKYFRTPMSIKELVLRAGQRKISEINMFLENKQKPSSIPKINPQLLYIEIKSKIPKLDQISNMSFTRNGKLRFATSDPFLYRDGVSARKYPLGRMKGSSSMGNLSGGSCSSSPSSTRPAVECSLLDSLGTDSGKFSVETELSVAGVVRGEVNVKFSGARAKFGQAAPNTC